jgi:hypothetical protein
LVECKPHRSQSPIRECHGGSELEIEKARKLTTLSQNSVQATAHPRMLVPHIAYVVVLCYVEKHLVCLQVVEALIRRPHVMADNSINFPAHTQIKMTAYSSEPQHLIPLNSTNSSDDTI